MRLQDFSFKLWLEDDFANLGVIMLEPKKKKDKELPLAEMPVKKVPVVKIPKWNIEAGEKTDNTRRDVGI